MFTLHVTLHDAVRALSSDYGKRPGCCYMIERGPNWSWLGHVPGVLLRLYLKLYITSILIFVTFRSSTSWIVKDIEIADRHIVNELGLFANGKGRGYSFWPPKRYKRTKQTSWCTWNLREIVEISGKFDYSELQSVIPTDIKAEHFTKKTKKQELEQFME